MLVHMVFGMFLKVLPVVIYRHFIQRKPTVFGFAQMPQQGDFPFCQMIKNWIKLGVVDHNEFVVLITEDHSDVLPDLYRDRSFGKTLVEPDNRVFCKVRIIPIGYRKSGSDLKFFRIRFFLIDTIIKLFFNKFLPLGKVDNNIAVSYTHLTLPTIYSV